MGEIVLLGLLAHPTMLDAFGLSGCPVTIKGRIAGGKDAGVKRDCWPVLLPVDEDLTAVQVSWNRNLRRYVDVFGLQPFDWMGQQTGQGTSKEISVLGVQSTAASSSVSVEDAWQVDLAATIALDILELPDDCANEEVASRMPMIATWASSRVRAKTDLRAAAMPELRDPDAIQITNPRQPYANHFAVNECDISHLRHDGHWSPKLDRAVFVTGDCAVVLPWDIRRDRVLVIEQFRVVPAMRGDRQPWLLEPIAGRIDPGETPEDSARREAAEEAGLTLDQLIPAFDYYPSPGAMGEYLYTFIAPVDLPDGSEGVHGLDSEAEDIRGHLMDRKDLVRMALAGELPNGPLSMLALWLAAKADDLRFGPD